MASEAGAPRVVVASDSFKGSLTSAEVADIVREELLALVPGARCDCVRVADGGEGTLDAIAATRPCERVSVRVHGPLGHVTDASYLLLDDGSAVVEMAAASGLTLVGARELDPMAASTRGTGELIGHALSRGARRLWVGIGGSATNDAGLGALRELGVRFLGEKNEELSGCGRDLGRVRAIDASGLDARLAACEVLVMCDVDNPLCGPRGATRVFAPQKGADVRMVDELERGMRSYARVLDASVGRAVSRQPGSGAAGGLGSALMAFAGARVRPGIDCVLDLAGFDDIARDADLVVTGEGRLDAQTAAGKAVCGVCGRSAALGVRAAAIVGMCDASEDETRDLGLVRVEACVGPDVDPERAMAQAEPNLRAAARRLFSAEFGGAA